MLKPKVIEQINDAMKDYKSSEEWNDESEF
jgi:hypothetical protein